MVGQNNSHINVHEAGVAAKLAIYLLQQGYDPSLITILTMYAGQRLKIMDKLRQSTVPGSGDIRVSTVDGFQGEENDIIILSLVRSNSNNSIGFLKTSNRVCVGLSRAKKVTKLKYDPLVFFTLARFLYINARGYSNLCVC